MPGKPHGEIPFVVDQHSISVLLCERVVPYRRQPPISREHVALTEENEIARRRIFDELVLAEPIDCAQSLKFFDGDVEARVEAQPRNVGPSSSRSRLNDGRGGSRDAVENRLERVHTVVP